MSFDSTNKTKSSNKSFATILLIFLYSLQGLVIGMLLETFQLKLKTSFSYSDIGIYLLCSYPFSLKILWSPIVDTYYSKQIGLRKSWIIPTQTIIAGLLLYIAYSIENILNEKRIVFLSSICFVVMFMVATQDIAVDGWALSLCGKDNCSLASSCQTIGQIIGIFISTTVFVNSGVSLESYFKFISCVFIIANFILLFIKEDFTKEENEGIYETLQNLKKMSTNKPLRNFIGVILFANIGKIFSNKIIELVLIEKGFSQKLLSDISAFILPLEVGLSFMFSNLKSEFLSKYLQGYKSMIYLSIFELVFICSYDTIKGLEYSNILVILILVVMSIFKAYFSLLSLNGINGFFNRICDHKIGATYITALNSANNLAAKWPGLFIFSLVDYIGYQLVGILSLIYCVLFYSYASKKLKNLEELPETAWNIDSDKRI